MLMPVLQIVFIVGVLCFFGAITLLLKKNALSLKYSLLWYFSALIMLSVSVFPAIPVFIAKLLGFELASNAIFSLLLFFAILILLSLTSIISKQNEKIKTLIQVNALLEKRVGELEKTTTGR